MYEIKKLQWSCRAGWFYSEAPFTNYRIVDQDEGYKAIYVSEYISSVLPLDEAKAAAQEHFEKEVMQFLNVKEDENADRL